MFVDVFGKQVWGSIGCEIQGIVRWIDVGFEKGVGLLWDDTKRLLQQQSGGKWRQLWNKKMKSRCLSLVAIH
jgi:hypothetical protein